MFNVIVFNQTPPVQPGQPGLRTPDPRMKTIDFEVFVIRFVSI
jgi:hypothetical protein